MFEQPSATQDDRLLPRPDEGLDNARQKMGRRTFDDEICQRFEGIQGHNGNLVLEMRKAASRASDVSRRDRCQHASGYPGIERLCQFESDGSEARDRYPDRFRMWLA
jgi:hypothetical protein